MKYFIILTVFLSGMLIALENNEDKGILEGKKLVKYSDQCQCYLYSTNKGVTWLRYDKKNEKPAVKIYPNPAENEITVKIQEEEFEKVELNFFKNNYNLYKKMKKTDLNTKKVLFNLSEIENGFYLIDVLVDDVNYGTFTIMKK